MSDLLSGQLRRCCGHAQVACGRQFFAAVTRGGGLHTWGLDNGGGRLGHGPRRPEDVANAAANGVTDAGGGGGGGGGEVARAVEATVEEEAEAEAEVTAGGVGGGVVAAVGGGVVVGVADDAGFVGVRASERGRGGGGGGEGDGEVVGGRSGGLLVQAPVRVMSLSEQRVVQVRVGGERPRRTVSTFFILFFFFVLLVMLFC